MKNISFVFILLLSALAVSAQDVSIELDSYTPRPVIPGEEFTVVFMVTNDEPIMGDSLELEILVKDGGAFEVEGDDEKTLTFTSIGEKSVSFTFLVDEDTKKKSEELEVEVCIENECNEENFTIRIEQDTSLVISGIETPDYFEPGKEENVLVTLSNGGDSTLETITLNLDLRNSDVPFSFSQTGSERLIFRLEAGDSEDVSFSVLANANAESGVYKVPLTVTYSDTSGEEFTLEDFVSLKISSTPTIFVSLGDEDLIVGNLNTLTLSIVNKGLGDARFLQVRMIDSRGYDLLKSGDVYVGDVDSDDFEVVEFSILPTESEIEVLLYLEYRDENNNLYTQTLTLHPVVYTRDEAKDLGIIEGSNAWIIVVIVIVVVAFLLYRRRKKKP